jgi:hypothetical protein
MLVEPGAGRLGDQRREALRVAGHLVVDLEYALAGLDLGLIVHDPGASFHAVSSGRAA